MNQRVEETLSKIALMEPELAFGKLISYQTAFIECLREKGKLPKYPLPLNSEEGQYTIRDMASRLLEELTEMYIECNALIEYLQTHERDPEKIKDIISNINEETSDTIHFMLNIFIYSGVDNETLYQSYKTELGENNLGSCWAGNDFIQTMFNLARHMNLKEGIYAQHGRELIEGADSFYQGGNKLTMANKNDIIDLCWEITVHTYKLLNMLKIRYWRNNKPETNTQEFYLQFTNLWATYLRLLDVLGHTSQSFTRIYTIKNAINWERQKE